MAVLPILYTAATLRRLIIVVMALSTLSTSLFAKTDGTQQFYIQSDLFLKVFIETLISYNIHIIANHKESQYGAMVELMGFSGSVPPLIMDPHCGFQSVSVELF